MQTSATPQPSAIAWATIAPIPRLGWCSDDYRRSTTTGACVPSGLGWAETPTRHGLSHALDCGAQLDAPDMVPTGAHRREGDVALAETCRAW